MKTILITLVSIVLLAAGKCNKTEDTTNLVDLQTSGCFGFCPVFKLSALNNGLVRYEGLRYAEKMGKDSFRLTQEELKSLQAKVKETNLWQYPELIKSEVMDAPYATLTAYEGEKSKSVRGSIDRPVPLLELEALMTSLAEAHGFQVKRGVNPNDVPQKTKKEVIVKLKPEINAGNWIARFTDIKLQLLQRQSAENIWVIAYDSAQIEEKALIDRLKGTDGVLEVQANMQVKDRN